MNSPFNGSTRRARRRFSAAQKAVIVKAHLVDKVGISDLCEKHAITVSQFDWRQTQLFEVAAAGVDARREL